MGNCCEHKNLSNQTIKLSEQTLYEKYGGYETVSILVNTFYEMILSNPDVAPFFEDINMKKQKLHQSNFISFVLGGPNRYDGRSLREAHAHLKITDKEFNIVADLLAKACKKHGVADDDINTIITKVAGLHDEVLNK